MCLDKNEHRGSAGIVFLAVLLILAGFAVISLSNNEGRVSEDGNNMAEETEKVSHEIQMEGIKEEDTDEIRIEELLSGMTLEQKIYQMFIVTPEQLMGASAVTAVGSEMESRLEQYPVGGIICFSSNLVSPDQTKKMLADMQAFAEKTEGLPLFLCVDEEGGRVSRIAENPEFNVEAVGPMADITSLEEAYRCGSTIGAYLHELGFNVDFAPDADVITAENNTVIGNRSFGSDADIVTAYASACSDGLHDNNVLSTFKHFPGHGATSADTHEGYACTDKTYDELLKAELKPFAAAAECDIDIIMAAHISLPNVTGDDTPCSLSYRMITEILREDLCYDGIVITDALNMGAVSERYSPSEAAVKAVNAGVDLLLVPADMEAACTGVYEAVQNGEVEQERIDESVRRILRTKLDMGREK